MNTTPKRPPGRPKKEKRSKRYQQVTVQLDPELIGLLDRHLSQNGQGSRSELVRTACREHLRRVEKRAARQGEPGDE